MELSGPWNLEEIGEYLEGCTFPLRLSCVGEDGFPRVVSVWFSYDAGALRCVSHQSSQLVRLLERDNRVGFEVAPNEPPYCGVRGQGTVELARDSDGAMLTRLLAPARWRSSKPATTPTKTARGTRNPKSRAYV